MTRPIDPRVDIGHVHLKVSDLERAIAFYHGVSEALYLRDPDGNGGELYWDRPAEGWPRDAEGGLRMVTEPLDVAALAREGAP